jgi:hypothetical protein
MILYIPYVLYHTLHQSDESKKADSETKTSEYFFHCTLEVCVCVRVCVCVCVCVCVSCMYVLLALHTRGVCVSVRV